MLDEHASVGVVDFISGVMQTPQDLVRQQEVWTRRRRGQVTVQYGRRHGIGQTGFKIGELGGVVGSVHMEEFAVEPGTRKHPASSRRSRTALGRMQPWMLARPRARCRDQSRMAILSFISFPPHGRCCHSDRHKQERLPCSSTKALKHLPNLLRCDRWHLRGAEGRTWHVPPSFSWLVGLSGPASLSALLTASG